MPALPINYAQEYARELANAYPYLSHFSDLYNAENATRFRPVNGNGVWIPSIAVSGARAVNRGQIDGTFYRNASVNWELKTMSMYREWDTIVDPMDIVETNDVLTIANITRTFNEFQKIPEMDAYAASKIAGFAGEFGGVDSTTLDDSNILAAWDAALAYMVNQRVNRDRVRCKVTPDTYALLKQAAGMVRFIEVTNGIRNVDRNIAKLDGVVIEEVPSDLMLSAYDFTSGWAPDVAANQISMLLYDPMSLVAPVVYETSMLTPPSAATKGKNVYYESYYYDVFRLDNRMGGLFAFMAAPSLPSLTVVSVAGDSTGDSVITVSGANVGAYGLDLYYLANADSATSLTYGDAIAGTFTKATSNPILLSSQTAGKYVTVALVNAANKTVVAGGNAVEVVGA